MAAREPEIDIPEIEMIDLLVRLRAGDIKKLQQERKRGELSIRDACPEVLWYAAHENNRMLINALLKMNVPVDTPTRDGTTILCIAAKKGHAGTVRLLLKAGAAVNLRQGGTTPLLSAAEKGHKEVIKLLLKAGANVNLGQSGITPLFIAAEKGRKKIIPLLLKAGAKVNGEEGKVTSLLIAAEKGHNDVIKLLLKAGAIVDIVDSNGSTPLYTAAQNGHVGSVELLLNAGANADISATERRHTPLCIAAKKGYTSIVELLLKAGVNPDIAIIDGTTALHAAALAGHIQIIDLLLTMDAYPLIRCRNGKTPRDLAIESGHAEASRLLEHAEQNLGTTIPISLRTPLSAAAFYGDLDGLQTLISHGEPLPSRHYRFGNQADRVIDRNRFFHASPLLIRENGRLVQPIAPIPRLVILAHQVLLQHGQETEMVHIIMPWLCQWQMQMDELLHNPHYPLDDRDRKTFEAMCHSGKTPGCIL